METFNNQTYENESAIPADESALDSLYDLIKKWSLGCGSLFGIPIRVHVLNLLLIIALIMMAISVYTLLPIKKELFPEDVITAEDATTDNEII